MQRNANGVESGAMQEREVVARYVVLAILLPECGRPFRSEEFQHQRADFRGRLRTALEEPHVTLWHQPVAEICCANKEGFAGGIDDLFVFGVSELRARMGSEHQKNKQKPRKTEFGHDSLRRKVVDIHGLRRYRKQAGLRQQVLWSGNRGTHPVEPEGWKRVGTPRCGVGKNYRMWGWAKPYWVLGRGRRFGVNFH